MDRSEHALVAGLAVLDLVNTRTWRGNPERSEDLLETADDCTAWAVRAGVISADERRRIGRPVSLVGELMAFRSVVDRVLADDSGPLDPAARTAILDAYEHAELVASGPGRRWEIRVVDAHLIQRRLALQLEWLLTSDPGRIGECADDECRWVFLDTSRGRNRRWCRSADCGNRYRVREHHRRQVAAAGEQPGG